MPLTNVHSTDLEKKIAEIKAKILVNGKRFPQYMINKKRG
jgi:hypothetical protein